MEERETIAALARALGSEETVSAAYLFGSAAAGAARPFSDVDVAVLFAPGGGGDAALLRVQGLLQAALGRGDVQVTDLAETSPQVRYEVAAAGRPLVRRDRRADVLFRAEAFVRYLDLRPFLEIQRAAALRVFGGA